MICQFKRLIYPKAVTAGDASYMIALYRPCEKVMDAAGNVVSEIKAVGYCLPTADNLRYDMRGRWSRSAKHGIQFEVEGFDEVIVPSKEGVIAYLCSGQIKGIGPKTAEKIYAMFGQNTLTVLDHEPEQLLAVSGISKTKLKKICDSYLASRGARDVVAFLAPHGVTPNRAVKLYKQYGEHTISDWASTYIGAVLRIAGLLHCADMEDDKAEVTASTMSKAIQIGKYFLAHSTYAYSMMGTDLTIQKAKFVLAKLKKKNVSAIKRSELFQMCRGKFFKKTEEIFPTLELLEGHGYIRLEEPERQSVGRPADVKIIVNPAA